GVAEDGGRGRRWAGGLSGRGGGGPRGDGEGGAPPPRGGRGRRAHRRYRLTHVPHAADGEGEVRAANAGLSCSAAFRARASERDGLAAAPDVLARHHFEDARPLRRRRRVDLSHLGVRMRAPDEGDVVETRDVEIADVGRGTSDEARIF